MAAMPLSSQVPTVVSIPQEREREQEADCWGEVKMKKRTSHLHSSWTWWPPKPKPWHTKAQLELRQSMMMEHGWQIYQNISSYEHLRNIKRRQRQWESFTPKQISTCILTKAPLTHFLLNWKKDTRPVWTWMRLEKCNTMTNFKQGHITPGFPCRLSRMWLMSCGERTKKQLRDGTNAAKQVDGTVSADKDPIIKSKCQMVSFTSSIHRIIIWTNPPWFIHNGSRSHCYQSPQIWMKKGMKK